MVHSFYLIMAVHLDHQHVACEVCQDSPAGCEEDVVSSLQSSSSVPLSPGGGALALEVGTPLISEAGGQSGVIVVVMVVVHAGAGGGMLVG